MKNHAEPYLQCIGWNGSVIVFSRKQSHFWLRGGPWDWSFMLVYFMSRIRIDALHVDVHDVLPPNETHRSREKKTATAAYGPVQLNLWRPRGSFETYGTQSTKQRRGQRLARLSSCWRAEVAASTPWQLQRRSTTSDCRRSTRDFCRGRSWARPGQLWTKLKPLCHFKIQQKAIFPS